MEFGPETDGEVHQATISSNSAIIGGGIFAYFTSLSFGSTIDHTTIAFNDAISVGGGDYAGPGDLTLNHSIVANGSSFSRQDITGVLGLSLTVTSSLMGHNFSSRLVTFCCRFANMRMAI